MPLFMFINKKPTNHHEAQSFKFLKNKRNDGKNKCTTFGKNLTFLQKRISRIFTEKKTLKFLRGCLGKPIDCLMKIPETITPHLDPGHPKTHHHPEVDSW